MCWSTKIVQRDTPEPKNYWLHRRGGKKTKKKKNPQSDSGMTSFWHEALNNCLCFWRVIPSSEYQAAGAVESQDNSKLTPETIVM